MKLIAPSALIRSALAGAVLMSAPLLAQDKAAQPAGSEKAEEAMFYFRVMVSAIQSDKIEAPVKQSLMGCIYNNSLSKISEAVDKAIAANPGKVKKDDPNQVLGVMAGICGYKPDEAGAAAPAPAPKPAPSAKRGPGR